MDGIFNIYKEAGMTSFDVVAKMRKIMQTKTVGHAGTLDPNATGVLVVAVGRATRVLEYMENDDKIYKAELTLGVTTDTEDIWGNILSQKDVHIELDKVEEVIKTFIGKQIQVPPMYSALKVNGKKLYELAREGKEIERKGREIEIFDISDIELNQNKVSFTVHCSKGTYIRTLCKDIGEKLGCGATMSKLERIKAGKFILENSVKLKDLELGPNKYAINLESVLEKFDIIKLNEEEAKLYVNGVRFNINESRNILIKDGTYRNYISNQLYGVCTVDNGIMRSVKKIVTT